MSVLAISTGRSAVWRPHLAQQTVANLTASQTDQTTIAALQTAGVSIAPASGETSTPVPLQQKALDALGALTRWIPTEIIAGYAALVTAMQPHDVEKANVPVVSLEAWLVALAATLALSIATIALDVQPSAQPLARRIVRKTPLAGIAFALWSYTIPYSAWTLLPGPVNPSARPVVLFGLFIITALFTLAAQKIDPPEAAA